MILLCTNKSLKVKEEYLTIMSQSGIIEKVIFIFLILILYAKLY